LPFRICNHTSADPIHSPKRPALSLPFPALGDSCPTRAEAGQAGIGIYPARRYCSPSQRLPPSGLILIYSTRLHPSHIIVIGSAFTTTTCIPTVKHTPKAARVKSHQIGFELYLGIAILSLVIDPKKKAFSHLANPPTHVRIHTRAATKSRIPFCDKTVKRLSWADTDSPRQLNPTPSLEPRRRVAKL
jgi:hypothetical protein